MARMSTNKQCMARVRAQQRLALSPRERRTDKPTMEAEWAASARALVAGADARGAWVETATLPALLKPRGGGVPRPAPCAAILHVLRRWTLSQVSDICLHVRIAIRPSLTPL